MYHIMTNFDCTPLFLCYGIINIDLVTNLLDPSLKLLLSNSLDTASHEQSATVALNLHNDLTYVFYHDS